MDFKIYLSRLCRSIDAALDACLPRSSRPPAAIHKAMRYAVFSGGKRIRPIIVLESARACGSRRSSRESFSQDALAAACAVELVHTYSLVHDDLPSMDNDNFRRGKPTCHRVFGQANAILAGDALLTLAFKIIACRMKPGRAAPAAAQLSEAIGTGGMVGGQALDIEFRKKPNAGVLQKINRLKTARLFEACARLGAIAAGSRPAKIRAMGGYGINLGTAFQIVDDVLDNDGYAKILGVSKAMKDARIQIGRAKECLEPFGCNADGLRYIADSILNRAG